MYDFLDFDKIQDDDQVEDVTRYVYSLKKGQRSKNKISDPAKKNGKSQLSSVQVLSQDSLDAFDLVQLNPPSSFYSALSETQNLPEAKVTSRVSENSSRGNPRIK